MTSCSAAWQRFNRCALTVLATIAVSTTTGCLGAGPPSPTSSAGWTSDINRQDPAGLSDGGDLRLAVAGFPTTFNPLQADSFPEVWSISQAIDPQAFLIGSDGAPVLNSNYFSSIELIGMNPQAVTYTINPKAVWTDGTPITWQDIASHVHALSGDDKAFLVNTTSGYDEATVTRGVDDRQAVITFKKPYSGWRGMFSGGEVLLPRAVTATPEAFNKGAPDAPSAGPFMVDRVDEKAQQVVLIRNPRWWGTPPRLNSITNVALNPDDQLQAFQEGRIDAVRLTSDDDLEAAKQIGGVSIRRAREMRWTVLGFNGKPGSLLADRKLREAISQGIDREAILNVLQRGLVDYPLPMNNHFYVDGQQGYRDNIAECTCSTGVYDPDNARRALDALGWKLNGDRREKDGTPLVIDDVVLNTRDDSDLGVLLKDNLEEIGVEVNTRVPDGPYFIEGNFDITQFDWFVDGFPLKGLKDTYGTNGMWNGGKIGSVDVDAKIDEVLTEPDENRVRDLANALDLELWEEVHSIPLGQSPGFVAVASDLANYGAFGVASIDYTAIGFMTRDSR